jgi:Domain of unknown function (DUF4234)
MSESPHYGQHEAATPPPPPGPYGPPAGQVPVAAGYAPPPPPGGAVIGKRRGPFIAWLLLPIVTLGIYGIVWIYKTNRELSRFDQRIVVNPWLSVLACTLGVILIVPPFVAIWRLGNRVAQAQRAAGIPESSPVISFVLWVLGFGVLYSQFEINKIWDRYQGATQGQVVPLFA